MASSDSTSRIILIIVGILVLSALGYFSTKYFSEKENNQTNAATIDGLKTEIVQLEEKIIGLDITVEDKELDLAEKTRLLNDKYEELGRVVDKLNEAKRENKANLAKIRQYEARVEEMRGIMDQYRQQLEALKAENQALTGQVQTLAASENRLKSENQTLSQQKENTTRELEETRQIASVLKVRDFSYRNVTKKGKEISEEENAFRKGALYEIKVCFTLIENLIAKPGEREVYLIYENPDGTISTNFAKGLSGTFMYQNKEKTYTSKTTVRYNRLSEEACITYIPEDVEYYQKGPQYISVYCDGHLIGQSSFTIR